MKKIITLLLILINLTTYGQTSEKKSTIVDWKSLTENNYSINYPENWELNKSGQMGTSFILLSPLSFEQDKFKENINLMIQDLVGLNIDLNKFVEISNEQIKTMITDSEIIENERLTNGPLEFQKVIYTGRSGIYNLVFEQYYWIENDKAFILTFTCEENQFEYYKTTGEKILNSFKIL